MQRDKILLESGTNELEIVEFEVNNVAFGINVAKVREIINLMKATAIPNSNPSIEGLFQLRSKVVPLVDLAKYFGQSSVNESKDSKIIVTEFNQTVLGFKVHSVSRIHRISWENIEAASSLTTHEGVVTGVIKMEHRIILLLDFEKIIYNLSPSSVMQFKDKEQTSEEKRKIRLAKQIMIAEDSEMLLHILNDLLFKAGYTNQIHFKNGKELWDYLMQSDKKPDLILTDIEMPRMDGHHLTRLIKASSNYKILPVIIFSSLINEQMYAKGLQVGADEQVAKPDIDKLISMIDKHVLI